MVINNLTIFVIALLTDGTYDPVDVERVRTDDNYMLLFLKSRGLKEAPKYIDNALKFRVQYKVNGK